MTATEYVILVDETDNEIGKAEKLAAHQQNQLHRAFSVFVFQVKPTLTLLLQQRALHKYHSPGLWTNTCCSHPRPGEDIVAAGERRLQEELGFSLPLQNYGWFYYHALFPNGLHEHEIDHILVATTDDTTLITPNPEEVHTTTWMDVEQLKKALIQEPEKFTPWFKEALEMAVKPFH